MRKTAVLLLALALLGAACGGGGDTAIDEGNADTVADSSTDGDTGESTGDADATTEDDGATGDADADAGDDDTGTDTAGTMDIADVEASVVQIVAQGSFVLDSGELALNAGSTGTGFVISEDGMVVTNNHVVTGAATLQVYFSGSDEPVNARQLGVSECADLAVIQLVGDGYQALAFREDEVRPGLSVFAAGYPGADDPGNVDLDYTLTSGIVGSVTADGETNWASVDGVMQHDAQILGGNSGGPLVDENGQVVGINYAGSVQFNTNYAISAAEARPIIDQLVQDIDVDSLGINGEAVFGDLGSGIFIRSVESGSPADNAGIEPGDLLLTLENLVMGVDGTMEDYCDVLRTKAPEATMDVQVYRPSQDLVLDGQINGDPIELPVITQAVIESAGGNSGNGGGNANGPLAYTYTTVTDDSGLISVSIPTAWSDVDGTYNDNFGPSVWAAPNIEAWRNSWNVPGIIVESSAELTSADIPDLLAGADLSGVCVDYGATDYDDGLYFGILQIYGECGGTDTYYVILAATPIDPSLDYLVRVEIQAVTEADLDAADEALNTFIANI